MSINISPQEKKNMLENTFTIKDFEKNYIEVMEKWYQKDDNGNALDKPKLGIFDGNSYDKIYKNACDIVKRIPNDRKILEKEDLLKVKEGLSKYKDKKSPNKEECVREIEVCIDSLINYIKQIVIDVIKNPESLEKMTKRTIDAYMGTLKPHTKDCTDVEAVYAIYKSEYDKPSRKNESLCV